MDVDMVGPRLKELFDIDQVPEVIADGFVFTEGPVWDARGGCLYFSDIPSNRLHRWSPTDGVATFREPSEMSNGLTIDPDGTLLMCEHLGRRVARIGADAVVQNVASHYEGRKLNSPNDIVTKSDGAIYFTDPTYGITSERVGVIAPQEQQVSGVYRVAPDGSKVTLLVDDFEQPNGLAFSPDESRLYVDDSPRGHIRVFDVGPDGGLGNGRVFKDLTALADDPGVPDGMKVDEKGNLYCTGPGGVIILSESGDVLGRIKRPGTANLAWGDADWRSLYLTCQGTILRIRTHVRGVRVGPTA